MPISARIRKTSGDKKITINMEWYWIVLILIGGMALGVTIVLIWFLRR